MFLVRVIVFSLCGYQHQVANAIYCVHQAHCCIQNCHVFHGKAWDKRLWLTFPVEISQLNGWQTPLGCSGSVATRKNEVPWLWPGVLLATGPKRDPWLTCTILSSDSQHHHTCADTDELPPWQPDTVIEGELLNIRTPHPHPPPPTNMRHFHKDMKSK